MAIKVGIPRGLYYYWFYPFWKTFFEELGAETVLSDHTTKRILDDGIKVCIDEACLPVKIYHGHVVNLKDKVDYLFIPRLTSISRREYICPKIGGLPDLIRNSISGLPEIIDTEVNLRKSEKNAIKAAFEIGCRFCGSKREIKKAFYKAVESYGEYRRRMLKGLLPCDVLEDRKTAGVLEGNGYSGERLNIAVLGHAYNINDSYSNMRLVDKLRENGANIFSIEMVDDCIIYEKCKTLKKKMFWNFGRKAVGSALHFLEREDIDGMIFVMSFGCGVDSFICDMVERRVRKSEIPFIVITLDEHSGEAGLNTRLEAFIDMIRWRKNKGRQSAGNRVEVTG